MLCSNLEARPMNDAAETSTPSADTRAMVERRDRLQHRLEDSNLGLIEWTRDYLAKLGARTRLTHDATGKKANLFADARDSNRPGLICPVTPSGAGRRQSLGHHPFKVVERTANSTRAGRPT